MRTSMACMVLTGLVCAAAEAAWVPVADWQFNAGSFLADSSGNGNTLVNYGAVSAGGGTTAYFDGSAQMTTQGLLDLTPYRKLRVSLRMNIDTGAPLGVLFDHPFVSNTGAISASINELSTGVGTVALNATNLDQLPHTEGQWQEVAMEFDLDATDAADVVRVWVDGTPQPDSTAYGYHLLPGAGYSFRNDTFLIGARHPWYVQGAFDYLTIETEADVAPIPEPASCILLALGGAALARRRRR